MKKEMIKGTSISMGDSNILLVFGFRSIGDIAMYKRDGDLCYWDDPDCEYGQFDSNIIDVYCLPSNPTVENKKVDIKVESNGKSKQTRLEKDLLKIVKNNPQHTIIIGLYYFYCEEITEPVIIWDDNFSGEKLSFMPNRDVPDYIANFYWGAEKNIDMHEIVYDGKTYKVPGSDREWILKAGEDPEPAGLKDVHPRIDDSKIGVVTYRPASPGKPEGVDIWVPDSDNEEDWDKVFRIARDLDFDQYDYNDNVI